jgi:putative inorganic carbon (hco3(-)) transporter
MNNLVESKYKIIAFYLLAILFIAFNSLIILKFESYLFNIVPLAIIVFLAIVFSLDKVLLYSVVLVPFSVPLNYFYPNLGFNIELPTEIFFLAFTVLFVFKQILDRDFDREVLKHPITISIYFYLAWMLVTVFTSTMPMVSLKRWFSMLWFIIPFYFMISQLFKEKKNIYKYYWMYIIPFFIIIIYTLVSHSQHGFSQRTANYIMYPFYNDHTSYGAMLAMYIPILIGFIFNNKIKSNNRLLAFLLFIGFCVALVFSYTRAAWVSLIGAMAVYIILKYKINYRVIIAGIVLVLVTFFSFQTEIYMFLERNNQDSSTDFSEHVRSISNVATDASNVERINRWNSAIRMFEEKPVFGWGPGTYQFNYAPFQLSSEKTIISTNTGDLGNAHSEYLGALSESGVLGMLSFIVMSLLIFIYGVQNYIKAKSKENRIIIASTLCGLTTYLLHGFLNNFLDTDKASVAFWGFAAIILVVDLYHNKEKPQEKVSVSEKTKA